jgi:hypothetical protein
VEESSLGEETSNGLEDARSTSVTRLLARRTSGSVSAAAENARQIPMPPRFLAGKDEVGQLVEEDGWIRLYVKTNSAAAVGKLRQFEGWRIPRPGCARMTCYDSGRTPILARTCWCTCE